MIGVSACLFASESTTTLSASRAVSEDMSCGPKMLSNSSSVFGGCQYECCEERSLWRLSKRANQCRRKATASSLALSTTSVAITEFFMIAIKKGW